MKADESVTVNREYLVMLIRSDGASTDTPKITMNVSGGGPASRRRAGAFRPSPPKPSPPPPLNPPRHTGWVPQRRADLQVQHIQQTRTRLGQLASQPSASQPDADFVMRNRDSTTR